jgi:hypothetical protein
MKSQTAIRICNHCNNLGMKNTDHHVSKCPVLAETTCFSCKKKGHTSGYCPEKKAMASLEVSEQNAPVANGWAQIAKKAMTDKDKAESEAVAAKIKADIAEKKKKEHDAYLERKARREAQAKKQKEYDDKRYELFSRHMLSLYGYGWTSKFHPHGARADKIPKRLYDRLQKEIEEEERAEWIAQHQIFIEETKYRDEYDRLRAEKKATLSEKDYDKWAYEKWEQDYHLTKMEELDEWLDSTADDYYNSMRREDAIIRDGKSWIEEQIQRGHIREISEDQFEYYP